MNDTPKIRFKEFTDKWEQRKVGDFLTVSRVVGHTGIDARKLTVKLWGKGVVEKTDLYGGSENTQYYIRRAGQFMYGKLDFLHAAFGIVPESLDKYESTLDSPAFDMKNIDGQFFLNRVTQEDFYLKNGMVANGSRKAKRIHEDTFLDMPISVPSFEEQVCIGELLVGLDDLITLHQRKYNQMINVKKSMLGRLFPYAGAENPQIRFGFSENWEEVKLGNIVSPYSDPVETPHDGYIRLGIRSHGKGTFHDYVQPGQELETAQMHRVAAHKFIVNITFGWEHAVAITNEQDAGKLVSHRFPQFSMTDSIDDSFLKYVILDERFKHHLFLSSPGGAGRNRVLNIPQMLEYKTRIPKIEEQRQIAGLLDSVNNLIDLYADKVQKLKQIKSACLDGMFI